MSIAAPHDWRLQTFHPDRSSAAALIPAHTAGWWSQTGSNRRPHACKARALPTELWPHIEAAFRRACRPFDRPLGLVGPGRLELPTLRLSGVRSNHLSYGPMAARRPWRRPIKRWPTTPAGLAIAPPDLTVGGEWKEKRRRRRSACFLDVFRRPNRS